jgi:hypothetical protein
MTQRYLQEDTDLTDWTVRSNSLFSNTNSDLTFNAQDGSGPPGSSENCPERWGAFEYL